MGSGMRMPLTELPVDQAGGIASMLQGLGQGGLGGAYSRRQRGRAARIQRRSKARIQNDGQQVDEIAYGAISPGRTDGNASAEDQASTAVAPPGVRP